MFPGGSTYACVKSELGIGRRLGLGRGDPGAHQVLGVLARRLDALVGEHACVEQQPLEAAEALVRPLLLDAREIDVRARIVGGRVRRGAVVDALDQRRARRPSARARPPRAPPRTRRARRARRPSRPGSRSRPPCRRATSARVCASSGVEIAHWLLLQTKTAGAFITAARFDAFVELALARRAVAEERHRDARSRRAASCPRRARRRAARGSRSAPQIDATFQSAGFHQPDGWPRHHCRIVSAGRPRTSPIADSRYDGKIQSSSPSANVAPAWIASWFQKIAYVPMRPCRW